MHVNNQSTRRSVRTVLLKALRYTPPGESVQAERSDLGFLVLRLPSDSAAHVVQASGDDVQLLEDDGKLAALLVQARDNRGRPKKA